MAARPDGRGADQLRPTKLIPNFLRHAEGSCLIEVGETHVICSASVTEGVPSWRKGTGDGWVTAEYNMLPRSGLERVPRSAQKGGRSSEIQRMIGRSLRAGIDLGMLGEHTIVVDCDVLEADGGTRTASITGGMVALSLAIAHMKERGMIRKDPIRSYVGAVSVGMIEGGPRLDLSYVEDSRADVDFNVVMTDRNEYVEVQGAAEGATFTDGELQSLLTLAKAGLTDLFDMQRAAVAEGAGGR